MSKYQSERMTALETEIVALKAEKAGAMSALGMARSEITTLRNRVAKLEHHHATKHELCEFKEAP
jgi:hypothetical protein